MATDTPQNPHVERARGTWIDEVLCMDEAAAIAEVDEALAKLTRLYGKPGDARIRAKLAAARAAFRATEGDPLL